MKPQTLKNIGWKYLRAFSLVILLGVMLTNCADAQKSLQSGQRAYEKDNYDQAIIDLTNAVKANPKLVEAYYLRGKSYFATGDVDKALADFNRAVELNPKFDMAYVGIGRIYSNKKDSTKALQFFAKAIELNPKNIEAYENRAVEYNQDNLTINEYVEVSELLPEFHVFFRRKAAGGGSYSQDKIARATEVIDNSKSTNADRIEAYKTRALAYIEAKMNDKAEADAAKAIELAPQDFDAYSVRADIYFWQTYPLASNLLLGAKIDKSKYQTLCQNIAADTSKALELAPQIMFIRYELLRDRAGCYQILGEYDKAVADYSKMNLLYAGPSALGYYGRAKTYALKGNYDQAIADFTKALSLDEKHHIHRGISRAETFYGLGKAYLQKGDFENAIANLTKAIEKDPTSNVLHRFCAEAYLKKGDHEKALDEASKSVEFSKAVRWADELGDNGVESYKLRAQIYRQTGQTALAEADEKKAQELAKEYEK